MEGISLTVSKAKPNNTGRGIAQLDSSTLLALSLSPGDIVQIEGKRTTVAKVWRAERQDWGRELIKIDGYVRQNANASIGDRVIVSKPIIVEAEKVVLAPTEKIPVFEFDDYIKTDLKRQLVGSGNNTGIPLVEGDIVPLEMQHTRSQVAGGVIADRFTPFRAIETSPGGVVRITNRTIVEFNSKPVSGFEDVRATGITYEDIGGLHKEVTRVREMIEMPLKHPEIFSRLGIQPPKGVLMHGPPGTGKTLIAKAVANESGVSFFDIAGPEIMSKYYGESEQRLREIFEEASKNSPAIIFIDELDSIAPKRENVTGEVERRVVAQLLAMMDGIEDRGQVIVIAATNRVDSIDAALRRPGRFDREIDIGVPDRDDRIEIIQIHTRNMPTKDEVDLEYIADNTHGFVGADLAALCKEAAMKALKRQMPLINLNIKTKNQDESESSEIGVREGTISSDILDSIEVIRDDFDAALKELEPSSMREVLVDVPNVIWSDVGGLSSLRTDITEAVEWPLKQPEKFIQMGIRPPKGVLMYGPPGTGKTLIAKAVANETNANFISVRGPELLSKWLGDSEKAIHEIFRKARQVAPTIIFFDEIDAIAPARGSYPGSGSLDRVVNQLLTELDGLELLKDVIVIAATNIPDIIDPALLRAGRFDRFVYAGIPTRDERREIFDVHTKNMPLAPDADLEYFVDQTEGYVGSGIENLCWEAAMRAMREATGDEIVKVNRKHFESALKETKPLITESVSQFNKIMRDKFKGTMPAKQNSYIG